ncbi:MAG: type VI secretion system contractile sheath large subunit [Planctomycetota bacterium]
MPASEPVAPAAEALHESAPQEPDLAPVSPVSADAPSLLDLAVQRAAPNVSAGATDNRLERFLAEEDTAACLRLWLGDSFRGDGEALSRRLNRDVAAIDTLLNDQLNAILHTDRFRRLEASWRGLRYLVDRVDEEGDPNTKVRALNVSWRELTRDFDRAMEFDQSHTWRKIYEEEFGQAGGEPFGVLLCDYEVHPRVAPDYPYDDLRTLRSLSTVAAAAFCPAVLGASPTLFGVDEFRELEHTLDHSAVFQQADYLAWRNLREAPESRFVALTAPRVLMRTRYEPDAERTDRFMFREERASPGADGHLWGTAVYAYGAVLARAFADAGWLADIRGARRGLVGGGLVMDLPRAEHGVDRLGLAAKVSTDLIVTDRAEAQLSELGFLPLCPRHGSDHLVFPSSQSVQKPATYDRPVATVNARISAMLQYMLCVSRFAHYVKVLAREKLGSFSEHTEFESYLQRWIVKYVTDDSEASAATKARYPLRDAQVAVEPTPAKPGSYQCTMHLQPHYELDDLQATVSLVAELSKGQQDR